MKKILMLLFTLVGIILIDTVQAIIFKNSSVISFNEELEDGGSWVDKGILIDTYYCIEDKEIITVSLHFKGSKFICHIDNESVKYDDYKKISGLKSNNVDVNTLVRFDGILYGRSYSMIDYVGGNKSIGIIDKLIDYEYVPKLNGETNSNDLVNALVFDKTNNTIVLLYNNEYVLFEKILEGE